MGDGITGAAGDGGYRLDPPDPCFNQYWVKGCEPGKPGSTCGGRCEVANACSPPENPNKAGLPMTFACPRFMLFAPQMVQAARDDTRAQGWGDPEDPPFVYGVVGHDADTGAGGLDGELRSTCCQCYQLVFEKPEPGSAQPPDLPVPKPMIVQSFNTAAGGGKNFDVFMGAGGYGAFNTCYDDRSFGNTSQFGHFMYDAFPFQFPGSGGIKLLNLDVCKKNGTVTLSSAQAPQCQAEVERLCGQARSTQAPAIGEDTRQSCLRSNRMESFYHQNWQISARRIECPEGLTRVTGCRLQKANLPPPDPQASSRAQLDGSWKTGYTTTTMQDCCKPSCAWKDQVEGMGLAPDGPWTSFYSCDAKGLPITARP